MDHINRETQKNGVVPPALKEVVLKNSRFVVSGSHLFGLLQGLGGGSSNGDISC